MGIDPRPDLGDGRVDEVGRRPGRPGAGNAEHEVAQDVPAARGVDDLGVELDPVQPPIRVDEAGERGGVGLGGGMEARRQPGDRVAVAHPDRLVPVEAAVQAVVGGERDRRRPVLALRRREDVATELVGHQVGAVADPEDGDAAAPDHRVGPGSVGVIHRARSPRQDDRPRPATLDLRPRRVVRQQLGVDVQLADATGDQLGELAPEVEHHHGVRLRTGGCFGSGPAGAIGDRALGDGCLQRGLEVGLDLGVVGRHDPVTGIGRRAVDGLAATGLRRRLVDVGGSVGSARELGRRALAVGRGVGRGMGRSDRLRLAQSALPLTRRWWSSLPGHDEAAPLGAACLSITPGDDQPGAAVAPGAAFVLAWPANT